MIKLKNLRQDHRGLMRWALNLIASVLGESRRHRGRRRPCKARGRRRSLTAPSQGTPEEEEMGKDSPPDPLEGVWPSQQLDSGLQASRTERTSVVLSQEVCDPSKLIKHFFSFSYLKKISFEEYRHTL